MRRKQEQASDLLRLNLLNVHFSSRQSFSSRGKASAAMEQNTKPLHKQSCRDTNLVSLPVWLLHNNELAFFPLPSSDLCDLKQTLHGDGSPNWLSLQDTALISSCRVVGHCTVYTPLHSNLLLKHSLCTPLSCIPEDELPLPTTSLILKWWRCHCPWWRSHGEASFTATPHQHPGSLTFCLATKTTKFHFCL